MWFQLLYKSQIDCRELQYLFLFKKLLMCEGYNYLLLLYKLFRQYCYTFNIQGVIYLEAYHYNNKCCIFMY
jgi:hypothetical protein